MFDKGKRLTNILKVVSYLLIFLPVALGFLFVYLCGVNVVWSDQWVMVPLFDKLSKGTLGMSDLWLQHGEHRALFPRLAQLLLGITTQYNTLAEMYLILTCFLVTLGCLWLVFKDSIRPRVTLLVPILFLPVSFLVFSLRQHENMLIGWQIGFAFAQAFSVLALYFLYVSSGRKRFRRAAFPVALGSATIATFSHLPGIFVWPAGLVQLLMDPVEKPAKKWLVGTWGLVGAVGWIVYFFNLAPPQSDGSLLQDLTPPVKETMSFLTLLGHPLFGRQSLALASGAFLVGLVAVVPFLVYRGRKPGEYSFWVALLLFSLLISASITIGRPEDGALQSRYVTFSILAIVGVYVVLVKSVLERKSYLVAGSLGILSVLILLSVPLSYSVGIEVGWGTGTTKGTGESGERKAVPFEETTAYRERAAFILATYESQPDEFLRALVVQSSPEVVRHLAGTLEGLGYNVFSEPRPRVLPPPLSELSAAPSSTLSEVESISGVEVNQEDQPLSIPAEEESFIEVTGWAVDAESEDEAGGVYLDIDGRLFPAFYGMDKKGSDTRALAEYYDNPTYRHAVFERAIPVSEIGTGTHGLSIVVLSNDKERYYRPNQEVAFEIG